MNKEQILEKDVEKVSGGAVKFTESMQDYISKHSTKVKCVQCGKIFELPYLDGGKLTPDIVYKRNRCPECREKVVVKINKPSVGKIESEETK